MSDPEPGPVRPPWWNDPAEQGNEIVRHLQAISARMERMNTLLEHLPAEIQRRVKAEMPSLSLFGRR